MKIIKFGLLNSKSIYSILVHFATFLSCVPRTILSRHTDDTRKQSVAKTSVFQDCVTGILSTQNPAMTVSHRVWKPQVIDQTNNVRVWILVLKYNFESWHVRTIQLLFRSRVDRPQLWKTPLSCQLVVQTHPSSAGRRRRTGSVGLFAVSRCTDRWAGAEAGIRADAGWSPSPAGKITRVYKKRMLCWTFGFFQVSEGGANAWSGA